MTTEITLGEYLKSLTNIDEEIKSSTAKLRNLRKEKKRLESLIKEILEKEEKPGVKLGNVGFFLHEKTVSKRKTKFEKESDILQVLEKAGVQKPIQVFNELSKAVGSKKSTVKALTSKPMEKLLANTS